MARPQRSVALARARCANVSERVALVAMRVSSADRDRAPGAMKPYPLSVHAPAPRGPALGEGACHPRTARERQGPSCMRFTTGEMRRLARWAFRGVGHVGRVVTHQFRQSGISSLLVRYRTGAGRYCHSSYVCQGNMYHWFWPRFWFGVVVHRGSSETSFALRFATFYTFDRAAAHRV